MAARDFEIRTLSSLTKVFADEDLTESPQRQGSALRDEVFSFQVAYRSSRLRKQVFVDVDTDLAAPVQIREVALIPSELPGTQFDDNVLRTTPGLYPDLLQPMPDGINVPPGQWRAIWITIRVPRRARRQTPRGGPLL